MKDAALLLYESQAINFLKSMTIKFTPISDAFNNQLIETGTPVDLTDPTTFKYYLNIIGQYHSTDTVMYVQSLDTKQTISFTVENLQQHPKTKAAYVIGSSYFDDLITRYPAQVDLIKSIVYPVLDINNAISADNFTILSFGDNILESVEQDAIVTELKIFIDYTRRRWYRDYLAYEDYFYWTYWGLLWQNLFLAIMAARLKYTKTSSANSFHVWQYLNNYNLGDYSDVLSDQQARWLYRNINYIKANKGKQSTLRLLANNLLSTVGVGLVGKTVYHQTVDSEATCKWVPEIVSQTVPTDTAQWLTIVSPESMTDIAFQLYNNGLDVSTDSDYINKEIDTIANTNTNILPTKLLEIQQIGIDKKYAELLNNFAIDTLVYSLQQGIYTPQIDMNDPVTGEHIFISGKEALALYYYCSYKSLGYIPTTIPTYYTSTIAYKKNILANDIPKTFMYYGQERYMTEFFNLPDILENTNYPSLPVTNPNDFSSVVGGLFHTLIQNIKFSRSCSDIPTQKALRLVLDTILVKSSYSISLDSAHTTYAPWIADTNHNYTAMFAAYDMLTNSKAAYNTLATLILQQIMPITDTTLLKYIDNSSEINALYTRIKGLFVELCSYNVAFLDTDRTLEHWFFLDKISATVLGRSRVTELDFDTSYVNIKILPNHHTHITYSADSATNIARQEFKGQRSVLYSTTLPMVLNRLQRRTIKFNPSTHSVVNATVGSKTLSFNVGVCVKITAP